MSVGFDPNSNYRLLSIVLYFWKIWKKIWRTFEKKIKFEKDREDLKDENMKELLDIYI